MHVLATENFKDQMYQRKRGKGCNLTSVQMPLCSVALNNDGEDEDEVIFIVI